MAAKLFPNKIRVGEYTLIRVNNSDLDGDYFVKKTNEQIGHIYFLAEICYVSDKYAIAYDVSFFSNIEKPKEILPISKFEKALLVAIQQKMMVSHC